MAEEGWGLDLSWWEGGWDVKKKRLVFLEILARGDENVDNCAEKRAEDVEAGFFIKKDDGSKGKKEKEYGVQSVEENG